MYDFEDNDSFLQEHPSVKGAVIAVVIIIVLLAAFGVVNWKISKQNSMTNVVVEIFKKGEFIAAESNIKKSELIKKPAKIKNIPLWYENQSKITIYGTTYAIYDLDKTNISANNLTHTITVCAPKLKMETHLNLDTYEEKIIKDSMFNPVKGKDINDKEKEIENKINEDANNSDLSKEAQKSFKKRIKKYIHKMDQYKDYDIKFEFA